VDEWQIIFDDFASKTDGISVFNPKDKSHVYLFQNYLIEMNMPIDEVDSAIKMLLGEQPETDPRVRSQAKKLGLVSKGYGNWGKDKDGPTTHRNVDGKLVAVDDDDKDDKDKKDDKEEPKDINLSKGGKVDAQLGGDRGAGPNDMMDKDEVGKVKDKSSKGYKAGKKYFDDGMDVISKQIEFESEDDEKVFSTVLSKIKEDNLDFTDEEKLVAQKYMARSDSQKVNKLYIARKGPGTYDAKTTRAQIPIKKGGYVDSQAPFMDDVVKALQLTDAPAQAKKEKSGTVTSKIRTKDLTPTEINKAEDIKVSSKTDSDGNVTSVTFGNREHKIKPVPDKQKLTEMYVESFISKGMDPEKAEKKAKLTRRAIRKHNEYLTELAKDRDKFTVSTMIEGADPSTEEGREKILKEYPKKVADIFEKIISESPDGMSESEKKLMDKIRNLDSNLSPEEYEKEAMEIMHEVLTNNPALYSGSADLAENLIALIQTRKGHEVYFPADVTYKVGDMISLGSLGDLNPNDEDYYDKLADEATSIIVTVQDEGPGSIKVKEGAASAAEEKVKLTEYQNKNTRRVLNTMISTHKEDFFGFSKKKGEDPKPITEEEIKSGKKKIDEAEQHARDIGVSDDKIEEINKKGRDTAKGWVEKYRTEGRAGTENWTDEDWENFEKTAEQFVRAHYFIGEINNNDMDYQKYSNYRVNNTREGANITRTDGVDCLGTIKPAPNMGFVFYGNGRFRPQNTYSSRIGNSCKENK